MGSERNLSICNTPGNNIRVNSSCRNRMLCCFLLSWIHNEWLCLMWIKLPNAQHLLAKNFPSSSRMELHSNYTADWNETAWEKGSGWEGLRHPIFLFPTKRDCITISATQKLCRLFLYRVNFSRFLQMFFELVLSLRNKTEIQNNISIWISASYPSDLQTSINMYHSWSFTQ